MSATQKFYKADFNSTLFPLKTNLLMVENHEEEISKYIYQCILDEAKSADNFLAQQRVYATKPRGHLRRTVKLDPVAEYYIYDVIYRNRPIFKGAVSDARISFGYRFQGGAPVPIHAAFREYTQCAKRHTQTYQHSLHFDIASYFNSVYHHDIVNWFASKDGVTQKDQEALGKFFREINSGRSVDFLPHGIYPCKMIGNEFLKFIDLSGILKSSVIVRFMDDFCLFDNSETVIQQDFVRIQQLLGNKGLNINPSKTFVDKNATDVKETITGISRSLKQIIKETKSVPTESGVELVELEWEVERKLSADQVNALLSLLKDETLEEGDADLILSFLRTHSDSVLGHFPSLLQRFPNITKHIYSVCSGIADKQGLVKVVLDHLNSGAYLLEYQLFWLGMIAEDYLPGVHGYGDLLIRLYELTADYKIARAKILEIPEQGFGLKEIRGEYLKTGQSDWLSWASAIGSRTLKVAERNYMLDYFSKGSPLNFLVASCAKKL